MKPLWSQPEVTTSATAGENLVTVSPDNLIALRHAGEGLALKAGRIAARQSGNYLSRFKGRGMEFDEARPYQPGDDVRTLDWRVTARTGKPHTKLFREERERAVLTWVDMRPSMFFATRGAFKSVIAARAAAMVGWATVKQQDRLGSLVFNADEHHELRPKHGKAAALQLVRQLSIASHWQPNPEPVDEQQIASHALARLRRVAKPGSLIFLMSDFRHLDAQAESHLSQLARHNDVVMFYIHDPLEAALPAKGQYRVSWGDRHALFSTTGKAQQQHAARFAEHQAYLQRLSRFPGIYFLSCSTADDVAERLRFGLGVVR